MTYFISPKQKIIFLISLLMVVAYLIIKKFWKNIFLLTISLWFFAPFLLLLFYTANKGMIWDYYLISQPLPFIILLSLALRDLIKKQKIIGFVITIFLMTLIIKSNLTEWQFMRRPECNAVSFGNMKKTIDLIYGEAKGKPFNIDIFVPNLRPISWKYLINWYGGNRYHYQPTTDKQRERLLFLILEPVQKDSGNEQYWKNQWYQERQNSGKIIATYQISEIKIEKRERLSL